MYCLQFRQGSCGVVRKLVAVWLAGFAFAAVVPRARAADDFRFSVRWNAQERTGRIRSLDMAQPAAQALLAWLRTEEGSRLLGALIADGRVEKTRNGRPVRREAGASGYLAMDGYVRVLRERVYSEWYGRKDDAHLQIGRATRGVPWGIHTHSWGNAMSGTMKGLNGDFAYAAPVSGEPGVLICLPLFERDGRESLTSGRLQLIAPLAKGVGCYEGRWQLENGRVSIVSTACEVKSG